MFVSYECPKLKFFKKIKNTYLATNFSKGDIFCWNLVTWPIFRFYIFLFFSKKNSGAVIPWDIDLHFCTWQGHFWRNIHEAFQMCILNNSNLWKNFEEHLSTLRGSRWPFGQSSAGNYMFKVNNRNTRTRCEICSKLTIKTLERRHWRRSGVFINFEHIWAGKCRLEDQHRINDAVPLKVA